MAETATTMTIGGTVEGGIRSMRPLIAINLGLVALQAISAGLFMSGNARAIAFHAMIAMALEVGTFVQAVAASMLWRRRDGAASAAVAGVVLFALVLLQAGFGYRRWYWLHVPLGVGMFGGLTRQLTRS